MITLRPSTASERDLFFEALRSELRADEQVAVVGRGLTWESLRELFLTVGEVRAILVDAAPAGFIWIEVHPPNLYVQSLILNPATRGRGVGFEVLRMLEREFCEVTDTVLIGTLATNERAISFYEQAGFVLAEEQSDPGFVNFCRTIRFDPEL
ncbi:MAG: GNAT family N-acetyltransferase [Acidimicrobiia bacterium]|nr:GNAT family N-acetyltransferase [Acidimicrobiia bacterium]